MANHAKVITSKTLDPREVDDIVQRLNKEKLGGIFNITYQKNVKGGYGKHQWFLQYKDEDYIAMVFWISDDVAYGYEEDGKWIESDDRTILSKQSCIEFRHGHSFDFMWWVEGVFRENLGKHYNAKMWDDGIGECETANPERYETFKTYASFNYADKDGNLNKENLKKWKEIHFDWQKDTIPVELIKAFNLDFDITI
jgi:hypothetical protein